MRAVWSRLTTFLRMLDWRSGYAVTWETTTRQRHRHVGTFRQCNVRLRTLLETGDAWEIAAYRRDGTEDTWLFPAAHHTPLSRFPGCGY
jgi:hypothetical protein